MLLAVVVVAATLGVALFRDHPGLSASLHRDWNPALGRFGLASPIFGTVVTASIAVAIAGPLGVLSAIWIAELAPHRLRRPAAVAVDLLATVPGVVFGLWGRMVVVPWVQRHLEPLDGRADGHGFSLAAGGIVLGLRMFPTVAALSAASLRAVPDPLREAAVSLGATPWETVRHVALPAARTGIRGAVLLALGRGLGEAVAVEMVCGSNTVLSLSPLAPGATLATVLVDEYVGATSRGHLGALAGVAVLLALVSGATTLSGRRLLSRAVEAKA